MTNLNRNSRKRTDDLPDPATKSVPKPGDFPLGSLESRAATRAMINEEKRDETGNGLLTAIQVIEVSAEGRRLAEVIRIPSPGKEQTS